MTVRTTPLMTVPHSESKGFFMAIHLAEVFKRRLNPLLLQASALPLSRARIFVQPFSSSPRSNEGRLQVQYHARTRGSDSDMSVQTATKSYTPKKWDLSGLQGISDDTLQIHFGLYEGYVKNTNLIGERLAAERPHTKKVGADAGFAELVRALPRGRSGT